LFGGHLGEHPPDLVRRDRHQRRLHPLEQRRLVLVGADDQRHRVRATLARQLDGIIGYEIAVDDRRERQQARAAQRHVVEQRPRGRDDCVSRHIGQPVNVVGPQAKCVYELFGHPAAPCCVVHRRGGRALRDRGVEQSGGDGVVSRV
jgi:hypothetical protein